MKTISKISYPKMIWGVFSIFFLWCGLFFLMHMVQEEYNFRLISIRKNSELIAQCTLSSNITVREYMFYSTGGATTSDSNSVYIQKNKSLFERRIWSAYSSPFISEMNCDGDNLIIETDSDSSESKYFKFSSAQIANELVNSQIRFYKGQNFSQSKPQWALQGEKASDKLSSWLLSLSFILAFITGYKAVIAKRSP